LHRVIQLSADGYQPLLDGGFDRSQVGGLPDKQRTLVQFREEVGIMRVKVGMMSLSRLNFKYSPQISMVITSSSVRAGAKPLGWIRCYAWPTL
jgi:hypothetical protein